MMMRIAATLAALRLRRVSRRLVRREDGTAAIEFAIVAIPFFALLFAIIETALSMWASQVMETAVVDASRLVLTGQAQQQGFNQARFKNEVCARIGGLFDCAGGMQVDVRTYTAFNQPDFDNPVDANGELDDGQMQFQPGNAGDIVVVRMFYLWPTFVTGLGNNMSDMPNNKRLLVAVHTFRNEPFN